MIMMFGKSAALNNDNNNYSTLLQKEIPLNAPLVAPYKSMMHDRRMSFSLYVEKE